MQGVDEQTGQMTFVASDLEEKIRQSLCSTSNRGEGDGQEGILRDLEGEARQLAEQLDSMLRELRGSLRGMADLTLESINCYAHTVNGACDTVDASIKATYHMLAKAEELGTAMKPVYQLSEKIKEMKRFVDQIESHLLNSSSTSSST